MEYFVAFGALLGFPLLVVLNKQKPRVKRKLSDPPEEDEPDTQTPEENILNPNLTRRNRILERIDPKDREIIEKYMEDSKDPDKLRTMQIENNMDYIMGAFAVTAIVIGASALIYINDI